MSFTEGLLRGAIPMALVVAAVVALGFGIAKRQTWATYVFFTVVGLALLAAVLAMAAVIGGWEMPG